MIEVDRNTLQKLRSEFPGSSWAIWSEEFPASGCVEESTEQLTEFIVANREQLRSQVILLSLNPSAQAPPGYQNFHSPLSKHYDDRLKEFIQENSLENIVGAYMTDIVPDIVDSNSNNISPEHVDIDRFLNQLRELGNDEYHVICFSQKVFEALQQYFGSETTERPYNITSFEGVIDEYTVSAYRVWHYSNYGANAHLVPELEQQLQHLNDEILGSR